MIEQPACVHLFFPVEYEPGGVDSLGRWNDRRPLVFYVCALCGEQGYPVP